MKTDVSQTHQIINRAINDLAAALAAGQSDRLKAYLTMLARFPRYSWGNVLLIYLACPQASHVAGYRTWQRLGRQVRRGAKAIHILAPIVRPDPDDADGRQRVIAFKTACVFDVSATEGRPVAEFAVVAGEPGVRLARLKDFVRQRGIALEYSDRTGGAEGMSLGGRIILKAGLAPATAFAALAHEAAHELLHHDESRPDSRMVRETEAEAVAFVVCQAIGLDTNSAASDYIQVYRGDKDTLLASLERIQRTAASIIHGVLGEEKSTEDQTAEAIVPLPRV